MGELKTPKRHFEIDWHLVVSVLFDPMEGTLFSISPPRFKMLPTSQWEIDKPVIPQPESKAKEYIAV